MVIVSQILGEKFKILKKHSWEDCGGCMMITIHVIIILTNALWSKSVPLKLNSNFFIRKNSNCLKILKSFPWKKRGFHEEMCAYQTDHTDLYRIDDHEFIFTFEITFYFHKSYDDSFWPEHPYKVKCSRDIKISSNITLCRTLVSKDQETKIFAIWLCGQDYEFSLTK